MRISYLQSGGLITNYYCSSACRHCLYGSSPRRERGYIDETTTETVLMKIKSLGCKSIHIGGGEPFLDIDGLKKVLETAQRVGMNIQYVETNSTWYKNKKQASQILEDLKELGLTTLLISISPFHNEFTPFEKVKGLMEACRATGVSVFPWIYEFYDDIDAFPSNKTHPLDEYIEKYGTQYVKKIFKQYWIHPGGRALMGFLDQYGKKSPDHFTMFNSGCTEITDTSHFHFDLYGKYVPGLCSGIQINALDMGEPLSEDDYPYLHILYHKGIKKFYEIAVEEHGFLSKEEYVSKCHLCFDIRRFLVVDQKLNIREFGPLDFYTELNKQPDSPPLPEA